MVPDFPPNSVHHTTRSLKQNDSKNLRTADWNSRFLMQEKTAFLLLGNRCCTLHNYFFTSHYQLL